MQPSVRPVMSIRLLAFLQLLAPCRGVPLPSAAGDDVRRSIEPLHAGHEHGAVFWQADAAEVARYSKECPPGKWRWRCLGIISPQPPASGVSSSSSKRIDENLDTRFTFPEHPERETHADREREVWLVVLASTVLGILLLAEGVAIIFCGRITETRLHPLLRTATSGLLVGLALVGILPSAYTASGWPLDQVMLLLCGAALFSFCLGHIVLGHNHEHESGPIDLLGFLGDRFSLVPKQAGDAGDEPGAKAEDGCCEPSTPDVRGPTPSPSPGGVPLSPGGVSLAPSAVECEDDDDVPARATPAAAAAGAAPAGLIAAPSPSPSPSPVAFGFAASRRRGSKRSLTPSWVSGGSSGCVSECCECPEPHGGPLDGGAAVAESRIELQRKHYETRLSCAKWQCNLCAWMLAWATHAFCDAVLLSGGNTPSEVLQIAVPVGICAVLDVSAMAVQLSSIGATRTELCVAIGAFGLCFPLGALVGIEAVRDARQPLALLRIVTSGVFLHMGVFEISPPHMHGRLNNVILVLVFAAGFGLGCL